MPSPGLHMKMYESKANRLSQAQVMLPAELASCICVRGGVQHKRDAEGLKFVA